MMRRAKNKRRKSGLATRAHLLMRVTLQLIHCLISLRAYRRMIANDDCYDPVDSLEISLFDDACYTCGQDANMNDAQGDELAIVPYVKHEIVAIAPTHDSPIIFLNSPYWTISEKFALIKDYIDGLHSTITHDDFDEYNMHVLAAPTCNYYERGTLSPPLYVSNMIELQETVYTMHRPLLGVHELFFYDMPMHRKRVRLRCCMICYFVLTTKLQIIVN